jgi:hypothetical protein
MTSTRRTRLRVRQCPGSSSTLQMIERRERLRLALETHQAIGVEGKRLRQDLERNITIEPRVAGPVDLAHSASTERRREGVGPEPGSRVSIRATIRQAS